MDMYFPPDQASTQPPMMIVAAANPTKERVIGVCHPVTAAPYSGGGAVFAFGSVAQEYLWRYEHKDPMDTDISRVQIKLLAVTKMPKHGQMTMIENDPYHSAIYYPDEDYIGKDRVEATVAVGQDIVRVVYNFIMQREATDQLQAAQERKLCPRGIFWKLSGGAVEESDPVAGERLAGMNILFTAAFQNLSFADLTGGEVGQPTGSGLNAQITLDDNGAGHSWYIDYTPYLNNEHLPTRGKIEPGPFNRDGTQRGGLVNGVIIGGTGTTNPYKNIREALLKLGFQDKLPQVNTAPSWQKIVKHHNHFHVFLQPPAVPMDDSKKLLAEVSPVSDLPGEAKLTPAIVLKIEQKLKEICNASENSSFNTDTQRGIVAGSAIPGLAVAYALEKFDVVWPQRISVDQIRIIQVPLHGKLSALRMLDKQEAGLETMAYRYTPDEGFLGEDHAVFEVEVYGQKIRVGFLFKISKVLNQDTECQDDSYYPDEVYDSSEAKLDGLNVLVSLEDVAIDQALSKNDIQRLLTQVGLATQLPLAVIDLPSSSLAQTTGIGVDAQITLDTIAAGHGWYIDYTPYFNDEYLPTSNPLEWIARPGSEAEGKMDLLTVLLHEYGHALGLEHTTDSHDLMAATLQPGMRRLPSASELELMAQLIGVAKETGIASPVPYDPFSPPGTPLPTTIGLAAFVAARQRRTTLSSALTQFEVAANPTLTNPQFADSQGWSSAGDVAIGSGAATLKETATAQTRLNQVFVVGENDRFLSFTLADIALDNVDNAPDDAFEVALIDANTGLSLLGGTGLSRNDAFLNLQADGTEFKASGVSTVRNTDGSRTVLVDLAGISTGTVVNLSFDLIGFGKGAAATTSRVTVKDLRQGVPQETQEARDDAVMLAEDGSLEVDVMANDPGTDQPGVQPLLVSGPAHGTVDITADGRFRYRPAADWFGEDRFSYKLSDGNLDANVATVKLTVTPVNDAPVVSPLAAMLQEDGRLVLDLRAQASDIDGDALTITVDVPGHGKLTENTDGTNGKSRKIEPGPFSRGLARFQRQNLS